MSFTALRAVSAIMGNWPKSVTPSGKLVLFALADRHNQETGRCDPSLKTIARDLGICERSVRDGLRSLEKAGLIVTVERTQRSGRGKKNLTNRYRLTMPSMGAKSAGGMGQNLPTNQEGKRPVETSHRPSAFDDLAMLIDERLEIPSQGFETHGSPFFDEGGL